MSESPIELRGRGGGVVFQGTQSPGGGSIPLKRVVVPLAFDTPDLAATDGSSTGVIAYTPTPGEAIVWSLSYFSVPTTGFDSPGATELHLTGSDLDGAFFSSSLQAVTGTGSVDPSDGDTSGYMKRPLLNAGGNWLFTTGPSLFPDATPLRVVFDDGASGDPGMTAGEGKLVLFIATVAS